MAALFEAAFWTLFNRAVRRSVALVKGGIFRQEMILRDNRIVSSSSVFADRVGFMVGQMLCRYPATFGR